MYKNGVIFRLKSLSGRGFRRRAVDSDSSGNVSDKLVAAWPMRSLFKPFAFSVAVSELALFLFRFLK